MIKACTCDSVVNTYACLRSKRATFISDDFSSSAVVQEPNDFVAYNAVESLRAFYRTVVFVVEDVDQLSGVLKINEVVERAVADVLTTPVAVVILITSQ